MSVDREPWLARHLGGSNRGRWLLELGCGPGKDARWLSDAGFRVVATDIDTEAVAKAMAQLPMGDVVRLDHARALPFRDQAFEIVVASLSLHYLLWADTLAAFAEVRRVLKERGLFVFRVNATDDVEFGATAGVEVEHHYRRFAPEDGVDREYKRFFDEPDIRQALGDRFVIEHLEHVSIHRWTRPKQAWECRARAV
jgi:SAM-dependent methyltransferase